MGTIAPTLLLVTDKAGGERLPREILTAQGYRVEVLPRGEDPLEFYEWSQPDGLIVDVSGPCGRGLRHCAVLTGSHPDLPALVMSARLDPATVQAARTAGAQLIMSKPLAGPVLLDTVRTLVGPTSTPL